MDEIRIGARRGRLQGVNLRGVSDHGTARGEDSGQSQVNHGLKLLRVVRAFHAMRITRGIPAAAPPPLALTIGEQEIENTFSPSDDYIADPTRGQSEGVC